MSRHAATTTRQRHRAEARPREALGPMLRRWREERGEAQRQPAAAAQTDTATMAKIERGARLPTPEQAAALAKYFGVAREIVESRRFIEVLARKCGDRRMLAGVLSEEACEYLPSKMSAGASKRTGSVDKRKKR